MHVLQRELKEKYLMVEDHCMGINMYKVSIWITYSALWSLWLILPYIYIKPYPLCGYVERSLVKQFSIKIRIVCHISFEQFGWLLGWLIGLLLVLCVCVCWVCLVWFCKNIDLKDAKSLYPMYLPVGPQSKMHSHPSITWKWISMTL